LLARRRGKDFGWPGAGDPFAVAGVPGKGTVAGPSLKQKEYA